MQVARRFILRLIVAFLVVGLVMGPSPDTRASVRAAPVAATPADACAHAGTPTNAVIRFYLAVDLHRYAAAYACFAATMQLSLPYRQFETGYSHTVSSRLIWADDGVPNGTPVDHVAIELAAVDAVGEAATGLKHSLVATLYSGQWKLTPSGRLDRGLIGVKWSRTVPAIPPLDVAAVFTETQRTVLVHFHADVTGDGKPDDIYITSGAGCGSCHAQQVWVYSQNRLVFQQQVDDAELRALPGHSGIEIRTDTPGSPGLDSCCPTERTYEEWSWTPLGFVLRSQHIVRTGH